MTSSTSSEKRGARSVATLLPTDGRPRSTAARSSRRRLRPPSGIPYASIEVVQLTRKRRNRESVIGTSGSHPAGSLGSSILTGICVLLILLCVPAFHRPERARRFPLRHFLRVHD